MKRIALFVLLLSSLSLAAQEKLRLDVDTIMRGPGLAGYTPRALRWSRDGKLLYFEWKQYSDPVVKDFDTYVVGRDGKGLRKLSDEEKKDASPQNGNWTRDRKFAVYTDGGDVFLYDADAKKRRALTDTIDGESDARFTKDENRVTFVRDDNLYVFSLHDGSIAQVTNIVSSDAKGPNVTLFDDENKGKTASQKWVADEAKKLSDVIARRAANKREDDAKKKAEIGLAPLKLKKGESITDLQLSPDEKFVIAFVGVESDDGKSTVVPSYVTASGYTADLPARRKVGDAQNASRVASISTSDGKVQWLKNELPKAAPLKTEEEKKTESVTQKETEATAEKTETTEKKEPEERDVELQTLLWSDDGAKAVMPVRAADNKDAWFLAFDPATGKGTAVDHEHDDAWVSWGFGDFWGFVPGSHTIWFTSERDGWMHLYTRSVDGGDAKALTSGKYEVDSVRVSEDKKSFDLTTSRESLFERHLYRMPIGGGEMTKLTTTEGWHEAVASPDGKTYGDVYSYSNKPWEVYIGATRITTSPAPEFATYPWLDVPIVHFTARDGASVPARIYKPASWSGGPAVIFVHGAGYLQNVHRAWSNYYREYMFHHVLMERGYLVLDVDYRASSGYGRDWRTAIYRHMGGVDLTDQLDAAQWLVKEHQVDPKRIGMYGGSYGGFMTLMAMFTAPGVFAAGAALRPVTDWAHYNHSYTSAILNTPQNDPVAYRRSSPIYFAEGLKGALLMCHGVIDVNVHYQDSVRLAQRLIELRKENWELAGYPLEDHGFVEPTSWADEYKRVLRLFERELK
jgi:dipeptidyl aminopeptidase/acylaminoacyl peptidase